MAKHEENMMEKAKNEMKKMGKKGGQTAQDMWNKVEGDDDDMKKKASKGKNNKMKDNW